MCAGCFRHTEFELRVGEVVRFNDLLRALPKAAQENDEDEVMLFGPNVLESHVAAHHLAPELPTSVTHLPCPSHPAQRTSAGTRLPGLRW